MQKQKRIILIFALAAAAVAAGFFYYSSPETKTVPYRTFYSEVAEGKIETAEITADKIIFTYKDSGKDISHTFLHILAASAASQLIVDYGVNIAEIFVEQCRLSFTWIIFI